MSIKGAKPAKGENSSISNKPNSTIFTSEFFMEGFSYLTPFTISGFLDSSHLTREVESLGNEIPNSASMWKNFMAIYSILNRKILLTPALNFRSEGQGLSHFMLNYINFSPDESDTKSLLNGGGGF